MAASELTQRCWDIAESLGKPVSESRKAYETICDEMMAVNIQRHLALSIASYIARWKETGNPHYVDMAFILLHAQGITTGTETMNIEAIAAANLRFNGHPAGTAKSIKDENAEHAALMLMANLVVRGMSVPAASRKAANYYAKRFPNCRKKRAATLEEYYSTKIRASGLEADIKRSQVEWPEPEWDAQWKEIAEKLPDCPDELLGSRR